jgi:hypothetical protein
LARLLLDRLRITPLGLGIATLTFYVLSNTLVAWLFGLYDLPPGFKGIIQDWPGSVLYEMIVTPVVVGYYLWTAVTPPAVIRRIRDARILNVADSEFDRLTQGDGQDSIKAWFNRWYWLAAVLVILMPLSGSTLVGHLQASLGRAPMPRTWAQYNSTYFILFKYIPWVFEWYMTMMLIAREIVAIRAFRQLFRDRELNLYPLHPDGCGGLRPLSEYALSFTYLIATIGLGISLLVYGGVVEGTLGNNYPVLIAAAAYFVLAPTFFFAPLGTAHTAMKKAKNQLLMQISEQFVKDFESVYDAVGGSAEALEDNVKKIEHLQKIYDMTKQFPVWPFDLGTLRTFSVTISAPGFPILLAILQQLVVYGLSRLTP